MIKAIAKDYEINMDGEKYLIQGDVWVGTWEPDGTFYGAWFTKETDKLRYAGEIHVTKKVFDEQVKSWSEI